MSDQQRGDTRKCHVTVDDLDLIFIRTQDTDGCWKSISVRDVDDAQFDAWARSRVSIQGQPGPWSLAERADVCDLLWQHHALVMMKRVAREG